MKPVWKRIAWETVMVVVVALGAYEIAGLDPRFNGTHWYYPLIHTISFEAYLHSWVFWTVAIVPLILIGIFEIWWRHHGRSPHEKLYYRSRIKLYLSKNMIEQLEEHKKRK
jgi:hypothetical protein